MGRTVVRLDHITKRYQLYEKPQDRFRETFSLRHKKYSKDFYALKDVSFHIEQGDTIGIVGKNGSGKSTLLKILTGVLTQTSGTVEVDGKISALLELGAGFNQDFTGIENIFLNGTIMGIERQEMEKRVDEIVKFADIGDHIYQPVKTYSSGMFMRLAFAVAINVDPQILIVDEALAVGDTRFQMKCMDKFIEFMNAGKTVIFVSHDINMIKRFCKRAVWINEGVLVMDGETDPVTDQYEDFLKSGLSLQEYFEITKLEEMAVDQQEEPVQDKEEQEESFEQEIEVIKTELPNPTGAVAQLNYIKMFNQRGEEVSKIRHGEKISLEIDYTVYDEAVQYPVLGVAIRSVDRLYVCGLNTLLDNQKIPWKLGRNKMTLTYERFNLTGGSYYFDSILFDQTATIPFDSKNQIKSFFVEMNYIAEGVVVLQHHWNKGGIA